MTKPISREEAERKLKARFLQALQCDDVDEVQRILHTSSIDIDTVFDVEDRSMILASYKQGTAADHLMDTLQQV